MVTKDFLSNVVILRHPCPSCRGVGSLDHPIRKAYREGKWQSFQEFAVAASIDPDDRKYRERVECPRCEGAGFHEQPITMEQLFDLVVEYMLHKDNIERIFRELARIGESES